jgi:hypothetical protein
MTAKHRPGFLEDLCTYPLLSALVERRTRRVPRGASLDAGALSHCSNNPPSPLTRLEEAVLICSLGVTGITTHDGPLNKQGGGQELGTPFMNIVARTGSSADNCQATSFFMINDEGIWLLKYPRGRVALSLLKELPPRWTDWHEQEWLHAADQVKVRISDRRLDFPREYPYYLGWNAQLSNLPGTTIFLPVVDCTRQYINALLILLSEPDGRRPLLVDDWRKFRPKGAIERLAWLGGLLGISPKIPYQPIGGLKWIRNGFVCKDNVGPLGFGRTLRTDYEAFLFMQNLLLVGEALGLGGWVHSSVFPPYLWQQDPTKQWHGLGFRMVEPKPVRPTPPVPASQPNPVGIDSILESCCPPYVKTMDEAVERVLEDKFGSQGAYGDVDVFARSYKSRGSAEEFLHKARRFSNQAVEYTKEICNYIIGTYGRFPAHVDAFYTPGIWIQFSHLEMEYYEKFYDPAQFQRQAKHHALWHS